MNKRYKIVLNKGEDEEEKSVSLFLINYIPVQSIINYYKELQSEKVLIISI